MKAKLKKFEWFRKFLKIILEKNKRNSNPFKKILQKKKNLRFFNKIRENKPKVALKIESENSLRDIMKSIIIFDQNRTITKIDQVSGSYRVETESGKIKGRGVKNRIGHEI